MCYWAKRISARTFDIANKIPLVVAVVPMYLAKG